MRVLHPEVTDEIVSGWVAAAQLGFPPARLAERPAAELGRWTELGRWLCAAFPRAAGR
jgi:hypothetical protein